MGASPQKEEGFVQLALDLFVAIMTADLTNAEMIVLAEVLLWTYGRFKRRGVHLDPITLEHYTGLHRNNVRAAIKGLVRAGILKAMEDGSYRFVKDYESWDVKGRPFVERLLGGLLRFARAAKERFGFPEKARKHAPKDEDASMSTAIQLDCADGHPRNPVGLRPEPSPQSNWIAAPNKVRAAEDSRGERREKAAAAAPEAAAAAADDSLSPGSGVPALALLAEELFPGKGYGRSIHANGRRLDSKLAGRLDCAEAALRKAARTGQTINDLIGFLISLGLDFVEHGIPTEPVAVPGNGAGPGAGRSSGFLAMLKAKPANPTEGS